MQISQYKAKKPSVDLIILVVCYRWKVKNTFNTGSPIQCENLDSLKYMNHNSSTEFENKTFERIKEKLRNRDYLSISHCHTLEKKHTMNVI